MIDPPPDPSPAECRAERAPMKSWGTRPPLDPITGDLWGERLNGITVWWRWCGHLWRDIDAEEARL